ncbi:hypothetical protein HHL19_16500 [Streptomyces sp. R302]|uniref:hypothetical protein n=1 Tax=unclassified Streptomyces TaxID=2593676 RepID=UPI00145F3546|nr:MULTISPECIES: hypothetical protein [unclassified Streptomyces]NML55370.1 hypothetical protein [Streptomyces sp. R301]NML80242.1 hypothetical protein [Streptomyces sp. R302]
MADPELLTTSKTESEPKTVGAEWDAIQVPRSVGLVALNILGARSGAVIEDETALYWLLPAGSTEGWSTRGTKALPTGTTLDVPVARCTTGPGPHWRICPGEDRLLTSVDALRAAVVDASGLAGGQPSPSGTAAR